MNSSTSRRDRIVVYTLVGIFTTSFLGLCMLMLAAGLYLAKGGFDKKPVAVQMPVVEQKPTVPSPTPTLAVKSETPTPPTFPAITELAAAPVANTPSNKPADSESEPAAVETLEIAPPSSPSAGVEVAVRDVDKSEEVTTVLAYRWPSNQSVVYQFSGSAEIGSREISLSGRNTLTPTGRPPDAAKIEEVSEEATGSGFLVTADGMIITCAHVVEGATSIEVIQGKQSYDAKVITMDDDVDLAVLQIKGQSFPFLKIGDSDRVRLADEVRAVGFPLADVLGESIKVTRGEVAGIGGPNGSSELQIDASFNPGNSGGPVIDNSGHVVGVANALLAGLGISEVGFAIPAKEIAELARKHHLQVQFDSNPDVLPPPDLIAKVSPAVVLLKVTTGPGGVGSKPASEVKFSNFWMETTQQTDPRAFGPGLRFQPPRHANFSGAAYFDSSGQALEIDEQSALPYLLGNATEIGIERLPDHAPGRVADQRIVTIEINQKDSHSSRFDPYASMPERFRPPWMRSAPERKKTDESYTGIESIAINVGASHGDLIEITKDYELKIPSKSSGEPDVLQVVGKGTGHFNLKTGLMEDFDYHAEVIVSQDNVTLKIPTKLKYSRVSEKELAEGRAKAEAARLARQEAKANEPGSIEFHPNQSADALRQDGDSGEKLSIKELPASSSLDLMRMNPRIAEADRSGADVVIMKVDVKPTNDSGSIRQFRSGSWGYHGLAFTPNAKELIALGNDNISVFDLGSGKSSVYKLDDSEASTRTCAVVSSDGKRLFAGTQAGYVLIWELSPGAAPVPEHRYKIDRREVKAIALSPDNKHVLTAHSRGDASLWELASGKVVATCSGFNFGSTAAAQFSSSGDQVLICDTRSAVVLDVKNLKLIQKMELTSGSGQSVAISPDAQRISAGETYAMQTWDTVTGQTLPACEEKQIQWSAAYSPNGGHLLTGGLSKITLWDVATGRLLKEMTMSESGYVKYVAFSPDGRHCAAIGAPIGSLVEVFQLPTSLQAH